MYSNRIDLFEFPSYGGLGTGVVHGGNYCMAGDSNINENNWAVVTFSDANYIDSARITEQSLYSYGRIVIRQKRG